MFSLHYIAEILRTVSQDTGLISRVIKFHLAQRMWSGIINVTDGQTDRQTDGQTPYTAIGYRSIAIAWSGKIRKRYSLANSTNGFSTKKHHRKAYLPTLTPKCLGLSKYLKTGLVYVNSANISHQHTVRLFACDPLSVGVITAEVVADSRVNGAVVVESTVHSVRVNTALRCNWRGTVAYVKKVSSQHKQFSTEIGLPDTSDLRTSAAASWV